MKPIVFIVIYSHYLALIGIGGVYSLMPLIPIPTINTISANITLKPIIETTPRTATTATTTTTTTIPRIPTSCPTNFTFNTIVSKCYYLANTQMTFEAGNNTCVGMGAKLLMPKTSQEQIVGSSLFPYGSIGAHLGVTFRTINGTPGWYYLDDDTLFPNNFCFSVSGMQSPNTTYYVLNLNSIYCSYNSDGTEMAYIVCETNPF